MHTLLPVGAIPLLPFPGLTVEDSISYISTGGGAFLEFLEGKKLPAIDILEEAARAWTAMEQAREL